MKVLLQHVGSRLYFCGGDVWTTNSDTAFDFYHPRWLREFVAKHQLREVQMVAKFDYPVQFEVVSLQEPVVRR
jgi:hypothetical protein